MGSSRVLVIEDERQMRRLLSLSLARAGYEVETAATAEEATERLVLTPFDLVLLDLGLPDMDGVEVCRQVREWSSIPIIVVSVREAERDKVAALDGGADDYVTKPFNMNELLARVRASLRRTSPATEAPILTFGDLRLDLTRRMVMRGERHIHLTPTEYDLFRVLAVQAGRVMTHRQLLRETRGPAYEDDTPLLRVHMVALRQKLAIPPNRPGYIATEPGIGYRMREQDS